MATIDKRVGGGEGLPASNCGQLTRLQMEIDFSEDNAALDDVVQLFDVPAGTYVFTAAGDVEAVEGAAGTFDLGDGDDPDGYLAGADANALGKSCSAPGALAEGAPNTLDPAFARGKFYATAGVIQLTAKAALDAAKVKIAILCAKAI